MTGIEFKNIANKIKIIDHNKLNGEKEISSAYWFNRADFWYKVSFGYNNPLNCENVHSELLLIQKWRKKIGNIINNSNIIFWGIGIGDTEMQTLDIQLQNHNKVNVIAIDINEEFLELFEHNLMQKKFEGDNEITFYGIKEYFEKVNLLKMDIYNTQKNIHCVLGSSIGNFNNLDTFFNILNRNILSGDKLFLGYQLNNNIELIFNKYRHNKCMLELIGNYLPHDKLNEIEWTLNKSESRIEAWLHDYQLFRSKKFSVDEVVQYANRNAYKSLNYLVDENKNICLHFLEKV